MWAWLGFRRVLSGSRARGGGGGGGGAGGGGGGVRYRHRPEPVRRVVSREVAAALRSMLRGVVERGTGTEAALTNFPVAAKTGTARRVVNGRYAAGQYTASFAALFPADQPQLVLVVQL